MKTFSSSILSPTTECHQILKTNEPGIVAHAFNSRTPKSEVADIYVFEASQGYTVRPCLKKKTLKIITLYNME